MNSTDWRGVPWERCGEQPSSHIIEETVSESMYDKLDTGRFDEYKPAFRAAIPKLTAKQQKTLRMYLAGMQFIEIAAVLGVHRSTVRERIYGYILSNGPYKGRWYGGIVKKMRKLMGVNSLGYGAKRSW